MEHCDESIDAHPEFHSSLRLMQKLDDFWFYGNLEQEENTTNPALCSSLVGLRPCGSIEMVSKEKILLGDSEEEEEEEGEERGVIASSSARSKLNAYLPCARFESMASISGNRAAEEERCEGEQLRIEVKSASSSFPAIESARSAAAVVVAAAMMPTNVQNRLDDGVDDDDDDDDDSPAASQIEVHTFFLCLQHLCALSLLR
jgi:hypothetical protein